MKSFRKLALDATILGTFALALILPAFAQQEIDPTWYDPWAKPAVHVTKVAATDSARPHKVKLASQDRPKNKRVLQPEATERAALVRK